MGLFRWLGSFFRGPRGDLYYPRERLIYRYFDGDKVVAADPMVLMKRLMEVGPEMDIALKVAMSSSKAAREHHVKYIGFIRDMFGLRPLAEGGLTEAEMEVLLNHFLVFCDRVKKNSRAIPTSAGEVLPSTQSSPAENPPTPSTLGSGSTGGGPRTVLPGPCPTGSGLPSGSSPPASVTSAT